MLRYISIYSQSLINVMDDVIISIYKQFTPQSIMTTWAVQPTDYGNEVKIWADVFDGSHFPQAKAHAERTAEQLGRPVTIWKVGSISEFKWMEVKTMRNLVIIGVATMLLSNTFQLRTNARIMTSNVLDYTSNLIHPYRSY